MTPIGLLVLGLAALLAPGLAVDVNNLREVVNQLLNRFKPTLPNFKSPIFSLVVRVPQDQNSGYDVSQIEDDATNVKNKILQDCDVYQSKRLIAATVLQSWGVKHCTSVKPITGHVESRVLQKFAWNNPDGSELLLFYISSSPCDGTCTNKNSKYNILQRIKVINKWPSRALVFSNIFQPAKGPPITQEKLAQSLENLAESVGRDNIYRCLQDRCKACFDNVGVEKFCVSDEIFSQQSQGSWPLSSQDRQKTDRSSSGSLSPQRGSEAEWGGRSSRSPSRSHSRDRGRSHSPVRSNTKPFKNRRSQSPLRSNTKPFKNRRSQSPLRSNTKPFKNRRSQSPLRSNSKPFKNRHSRSPSRARSRGWGYRMVFA